MCLLVRESDRANALPNEEPTLLTGSLDCPHICERCGATIKTPLTDYGVAYVREEVGDNKSHLWRDAFPYVFRDEIGGDTDADQE